MLLLMKRRMLQFVQTHQNSDVAYQSLNGMIALIGMVLGTLDVYGYSWILFNYSNMFGSILAWIAIDKLWLWITRKFRTIDSQSYEATEFLLVLTIAISLIALI